MQTKWIVSIVASLSLFVAAAYFGTKPKTNPGGGLLSAEQLCRAGLAALYGHELGVFQPVEIGNRYVVMVYNRPSDGAQLTAACNVWDEEIRWRDSSMTDWNSSSRIFYEIENEAVRIQIQTNEQTANRAIFAISSLTQ